MIERHADEGVAVGAANDERFAHSVERHAAGDELLCLCRNGNGARIEEIALVEIEAMHDLVLATADVQRLALGVEAEAVPRLIHRGAADDPRASALQFEDDDLVRAESSVQDREPFAARMEFRVHGEIAEFDLCADWA